MSSIVQFDQQLFLWIHQHCHNSFLDMVLPWFRHKENWHPMYAVIIIALIVRYRWLGLRIVLTGVLCLLLSDGISSHVIKPLVKRPRPCNDVLISKQYTPLIECSSGYSFTSSHAANHFSIVFALCLFFYKKRKWILFTGIVWAASIAFAQVYVGVHYPLDITAGTILGIGIAVFIHWLIKTYFAKYFIMP